ncbi:scarecrow-like protein 32 [Diospyros lotus]|uniref:scarecrow-like protein 32 n=1 Tax=Diospyros lotus TaxID=55363 RepID=UPI00225C0BC3|nr:scarecrow-like protein 32 [Diospyros lotus]
MKAELRGSTTPINPLQNSSLFSNTQSSLSGALQGCLGSLDGACIEQLLLHCASALERNDVTLAQQVMWVLNNVACSLGDPNQRLTSWFLRALISRASRVYPAAISFNGGSTLQTRSMSVIELAGYVDLIPWHRFGFCASNSSILKAIEGCSRVHILDFSITYCMQWPTFIDALGKRQEGPPSLRISVPSWRPPVPPLLNMTSEEVGQRLANFAKSRDVLLEFNVIHDQDHSSPTDDLAVSKEPSSFPYDSLLNKLNPLTLDLRDDEALVINCQNWLRYLSDEPRETAQGLSFRETFLEIVKGLFPRIIIIVDEDSDLAASSLTSRIATSFNYLWIPFDALETFLPKDSPQRVEYEADIGHKIENIIGFEGNQRIERLESGARLSQRMRNAGCYGVPFDDETVREVKLLLNEHASGWGMKKDDDMLVLTWKGHNSVYATAWVPVGFED